MYKASLLFSFQFPSDLGDEYATRARRLWIESQCVLQGPFHCGTHSCKCYWHHFCLRFLIDTCQINVIASVRVLTRVNNHVTISSFCAVEKLHVE